MGRRFGRIARFGLASLVLSGLLLFNLTPKPVNASTTIIVTTTSDTVATDGYCSLREAIIAANKDQASSSQPGECPAGSGTDTIVLPAGTFTLTRTDKGQEDSSSTGDLDISSNMSVQGAGADKTFIVASTNFNDRIFQILSGKVTISGATIRGGNVSKQDGGGILNAGNLSLEAVVVTGNKTTGNGGGVANTSAGTLAISKSTISNNTAGVNGGGLANFGASTFANDTVSGNTAAAAGGGLYTAGNATLNNLTIAGNVADSDQNGSGDGGGLFQSAGTLNLSNSIVAGNLDRSNKVQYPDCAGALASLGYNLIQSTAGCSISGTTTGNLLGLSPALGLLQDNGGPTPTMALQNGSPAVDAGSPALPGVGGGACEIADQRGVSRPQGLHCDMGAFELENPLQTGPIYTVNTTDDAGSFCAYAHCPLRQAILAANAHPNGLAPDQIVFNIPGSGAQTISPDSALPVITDPLLLDGSSQPNGSIILDGSGAGPGVDGLAIGAGGTTVHGLTIQNFSANGVRLFGGDGDQIHGNTLIKNGEAGVAVVSGRGDTISANSIADNSRLGIDLGGDGVTANSASAMRTGPNDLQNFPVLYAAAPVSGGVSLTGRLNAAPDAAYTLEFFSNGNCDPSGYGQGASFLTSIGVTTDSNGNAHYSQILPNPGGNFITATATSASGDTSEFSPCVTVGPQNLSWPDALEISAGAGGITVDQYLDSAGQSRWYKFPVQPDSKVVVTLTNLPANYDLTLCKDIGAAFQNLTSPQDLVRLGAEFAPDAFSPDAFSPDAFSPDAFSPDAFSPDAFSPDAFSPDAFSPDAFSPDAFSPDAFSPDAFSPDAFSPDAFSPDAFSPDAFSPDAFSPDAFSGAQTRSLIGASAFEGTASEGILANTWENSGYFYVRVRGRNGAFSLSSPFHLTVYQLTGQCSVINSNLPATSLSATAGGYKTIILTDMARLGGTLDQLAALQQRLAALAARPEVAGVVVDVDSDARVSAANLQADSHPACPNAKNLVADAVKSVLDRYWASNPLQYVVIVGNDSVIPFFRHPDQALLANESHYVPPVKDSSPSQASLKLGYVLSQDRYGARLSISSSTNTIPIPDLAVGRLVETPDEISGMLDAYLGTSFGVVSTPTTAMVSGYDFLALGAQAVAQNLGAGIGRPVDSLINTRNVAPTDPSSWTADQLRAMLLGSRHDLIYLSGHFSANTALAADYTSRMLASELANSSVDLTNSIVFSAGCHAAYNIVDQDAIPGVTLAPDWPEAFAMKRATLIAGTGYQYGDTDFIKYSEVIYQEFSHQLLAGSGPVSIGQALVAAKQTYLADTPDMQGINEKAYLEVTLYGLPMLSVNLPAGRFNPSGSPSIVSSVTPFDANPGQMLGLGYADVSVTPDLTPNTIALKNPVDGSLTNSFYLSGSSGVSTNPDQPVMPLEIRNVSVPGTVLRGVGFRAAAYTDLANILPLTGSATTELRGVHSPFFSDVYWPVVPWSLNYFAALSGSGSAINLILEPSQYQSDAPFSLTGTMRRYNQMAFRLFYSDNVQTYPTTGYTPALAAAPSIAMVRSSVANGEVAFHVRAVGDPSAGIQSVWITYTGMAAPFYGLWQSLDLTQDPNDTTLWTGSLPLNGADPLSLRYIVQAANGVGLVSLDANIGRYYTPGVQGQPTTPTSLALQVPASSGPYGSPASVSAVLTSNGVPLPGMRVSIGVGPLVRQVVTAANGVASVTIPLLASPGGYPVQASFAGTPVYIASSAVSTFTITKQDTKLVLVPQPASVQYSDDGGLKAILTDAAGRPIPEATVFFVVYNPSATYATSVITDFAGRAPLGRLLLPAGSYTVDAYFSGTIPLPGQTVTLDDYRYTPSRASGSVIITPENASLVYSGDTAVAIGSPVHLSVAVTQEIDGQPGDITLAQVAFTLTDVNGRAVTTVTSPVDANGKAVVLLNNLPLGIYQIQAQVIGGFFTSSPIYVLLAVYDNTATDFTTGSASINSPAGSYPANQQLSGSVSFGFNAQYQSNSPIPTGQTQFAFQIANLNFHSTSYDWLVIQGARAQFLGSGTINNAGNFGFFITVIDGDDLTPSVKDLFRMKIWDKATGQVVYDSQPGAPDIANPIAPITGGSITVH